MATIAQKKIKDKAPLVAPAKLNIWLFMLASSMLFAALVSAFVVHQPDAKAKETWTMFNLPTYFLVSLIISIVSSITIYAAFRNAKNDELIKNRTYLIATFVLGILFCISQYLGWKELVSMKLTFVNPRPEDISASYVWMITVVHVVHVLGGIILLSVGIYKSLKLEIHKKQLTFMSVTHTYWHFVGLLWFILYLFLYFAR
jgi:cytochrome c oxidase subunit 3